MRKSRRASASASIADAEQDGQREEAVGAAGERPRTGDLLRRLQARDVGIAPERRDRERERAPEGERPGQVERGESVHGSVASW